LVTVVENGNKNVHEQEQSQNQVQDEVKCRERG
jgi:hypothetical protein